MQKVDVDENIDIDDFILLLEFTFFNISIQNMVAILVAPDITAAFYFIVT